MAASLIYVTIEIGKGQLIWRGVRDGARESKPCKQKFAEEKRKEHLVLHHPLKSESPHP